MFLQKLMAQYEVTGSWAQEFRDLYALVGLEMMLLSLVEETEQTHPEISKALDKLARTL